MIIPKLLKLIAGKLSLTSKPKRAFTLLELLIVIGIIGSLTAIAVLILNPARYFSQSRDGRRLSEIQSIHKALSLIKTTNTNITYFGNPNWFYISLPDPALSGNATSTCGGL
ncbi:MAG: type II secretion system protein, partial [Patescibacteria group bacterium]